ncbi:MAG: hypothetical protein IJU51_02530 [Clostridia bacterium]|nr:hypothetical protein [Clostridia bacterium]
MKTNVKGVIGLITGLAALGLLGTAAFLHPEKLTGFGINGKMSFFGMTNIIMAWSGVAIAIAAIVFGVMANKKKDTKGPKKAGIVIGIIGVIIGLAVAGVVSLFSSITEFVNSDGKSGMLAEAISNSPDSQKNIDDFVRALQRSAGVEETGFMTEKPESSDNR